MSVWEIILQRPSDLTAAIAESWMAQIAEHLLDRARLLVAGDPYRIVEIEFYYCGHGHMDPFTHRDSVQLELGRWYFHRTGKSYRNGSFKGLDLTFGDGASFGGILIRCVEAPDGTLIDGPSLCVDHFLARVGVCSVADLAETVSGRAAWERETALALVEVPSTGAQIIRTARVGLSLRRAGNSAELTRYIMQPYRFLTEPRRVKKGKPYLVLALHAQGHDPVRIRQITGCPRKNIERYIEDFKVGWSEAEFTPFFGIELGPRELCRLHGAWYATKRGQDCAQPPF